MQLPIAELTNDELHSPLRADEGAVAQRAVATDAIRPTHAHTHTARAQAPEHRNTALVSTRRRQHGRNGDPNTDRNTLVSRNGLNQQKILIS